MKYSKITILYNPNSTGPSKSLATKLKSELAHAMPSQKVNLVQTKYAGHAEQIAMNSAKSKTKLKSLLISSSGDGGYHELINGIMKVSLGSEQVIVGLLPAGNANDHYNNVHEGDTVKSITSKKIKQIDLLMLTGKVNSKSFTRYAHSYIGIGLTPKAGAELNKTKLNWLNEVLIVMKVLLFLRPTKILISGKPKKFDSLIFSNVQNMSKVLGLSKTSQTDDGKFEIIMFRRRNKLSLLARLLKASTFGLSGNYQSDEYKFKTIKPVLVQLDGEIFTLDGNAEVSISIMPKTLKCII